MLRDVRLMENLGCIANYLVPDTREQFRTSTSIQLLSTSKASDDNLPSIFNLTVERTGSLRGDLVQKFTRGPDDSINFPFALQQ